MASQQHSVNSEPMHSDQTHYDLIIVGGGMVGAAIACGLAPTGMQIAVLEQSEHAPVWQAEKVDPRVSALTEASRTFLEHLGVWAQMPLLRVTPYQKMKVWEADGTGHIEFSCDDLFAENIGHIVENSVTLTALLNKMATYANVQLLRGVQLLGITEAASQGLGTQRSVLLADGRQLSAQLLVATDGARSKLREWGNFETREWDYGHNAIVTTIQLENSHQGTAWQRFMPTGPLALLPITQQGDDHYCSIVWSATEEEAERLMALNESEFCAELGLAFEHRLGKVLACDPRFSFPLRQRHAKQYWHNSLVLAGDAAHTIHPLAGQGVNLGLLDAATLVEVLTQAWQRQQPLGIGQTLQKYQRRRMPDNLKMMALMEAFKRLYGPVPLPLRWVRNLGMNMVNNSPLIKKQLLRQALGERDGLPDSAQVHLA
ncbi:2-octaprenylphenol hydroxylase [Oceanospirillum multiglobuliferum]|nr:FAD-dependent monooxygenase [Oceanospirillum multiglobuliferum]SKA26213.1 2-octaprenylphenol hydroxylase [Oceanospirillum multiglobuliferum]